jgi:hypothetical protein
MERRGKGCGDGAQTYTVFKNTIFILLNQREGARGDRERMCMLGYLRLASLAGERVEGSIYVTRVEGADRVKVVGVHPHPRQAGPKIPS